MIRLIKAQLSRDLYLGFVKKAEWLNPLIFLLLVQSLFPLALGADTELLTKLAPAVLWVSVLLSSLISIESLFRTDCDDGSLEQMFVNGHGLYCFCFSKIISHWLMSGLPLVVLSPLLGTTYYLSNEALWILFLALFLATPILCCISALASALTLNAKRGGVLLSLIVLPLYVPVLIFGSGALINTINGDSPLAALYLLTGALIFFMTLSPFVLGAALKMGINDA